MNLDSRKLQETIIGGKLFFGGFLRERSLRWYQYGRNGLFRARGDDSISRLCKRWLPFFEEGTKNGVLKAIIFKTCADYNNIFNVLVNEPRNWRIFQKQAYVFFTLTDPDACKEKLWWSFESCVISAGSPWLIITCWETKINCVHEEKQTGPVFLQLFQWSLCSWGGIPTGAMLVTWCVFLLSEGLESLCSHVEWPYQDVQPPEEIPAAETLRKPSIYQDESVRNKPQCWSVIFSWSSRLLCY